jgi:hypothetical protein
MHRRNIKKIKPLSVVIFMCVAVSVYYFISYFLNKPKEGLTVSGKNIILLGDSILANDNYVPREKSVINQLNEMITANNLNIQVKRHAYDNQHLIDLKHSKLLKHPNYYRQFNASPNYFIISIGGNDLLKYLKGIDDEATRVNKTIDIFEKGLMPSINKLKQYYPYSKFYFLNLYYPDPTKYSKFTNSITKWNSLLNTNASTNNYTVIDITDLKYNSGDLTYEIEPSVTGGTKIAQKIFNIVK